MNPMIASIVIFAIVYILIASEKVQKTVAALLGASAVVLLGLLDFDSAMKAIDLNGNLPADRHDDLRGHSG